jgi:cell division protein FtsQ
VSPIAAPSDRRFRRAHVKPARKRREWRRIVKPLVRYGLTGLALIYGAYRGSSVVAHARVLQIDRIVVRGNERLSNGDVLAVLSGLRGESLVWTDLNVWRRRLLASPWVRDAALRRSLPSTVEVAILERRPIGVGRLNGDMFLVDERGVVIDQYGPQYADLDLPIIDGLSAPPGDGGGMTDVARAELAARLIAALKAKPDIARRLSQVDVADLHNASVILEGDPAVLHLGDDQFLQRLQSYLELAPALRERVPDIDYVDLRFEHRIYVRPARTARSAGGPASAPSASAPSASASSASAPSALRRDKSALRRDESALRRDESALRRGESALRRGKPAAEVGKRK